MSAQRRRGWDTFASILRHLQITPSTTHQIAAVFGMGNCVIRSTMERMHDLGLVRHAGWTRIKSGPHAVVWGWADGRHDEPRPSRKPGVPRDRTAGPNRRPLLLAMAIVVRAMSGAAPADSDAIIRASGVHPNALREFLIHCRAIGFVRVAGWRRNQCGSPAPLYAIGSAPDAPRPVPMTREEYWRRSSAKRKAERARRGRLLEKTAMSSIFRLAAAGRSSGAAA